MTDAERKLWSVLKSHQLDGYGFRRQAPMGPYYADFVCHEIRLVVELDGSQHGEPDGLARDRRRDAWFEARGYRVLRFWNNDVLANAEGVVTAIRGAWADAGSPSQPSPARGEGSPIAAADLQGDDQE